MSAVLTPDQMVSLGYEVSLRHNTAQMLWNQPQATDDDLGPDYEEPEEQFTFCLLDEIWEVIIKFLGRRELLVCNRVSKFLYKLAQPLLWNYPKFRIPMTSSELGTMTHLPIRRLSTLDLEIDRPTCVKEFIRLFYKFKGFEGLSVDGCACTGDANCAFCYQTVTLQHLTQFAPCVTSVHLKGVRFLNLSEFSRQVEMLCNILKSMPRLQFIVLDGKDREVVGAFSINTLFSLEDLSLISQFPIREIYMSKLKHVSNVNFLQPEPELREEWSYVHFIPCLQELQGLEKVVVHDLMDTDELQLLTDSLPITYYG